MIPSRCRGMEKPSLQLWLALRAAQTQREKSHKWNHGTGGTVFRSCQTILSCTWRIAPRSGACELVRDGISLYLGERAESSASAISINEFIDSRISSETYPHTVMSGAVRQRVWRTMPMWATPIG